MQRNEDVQDVRNKLRLIYLAQRKYEGVLWGEADASADTSSSKLLMV